MYDELLRGVRRDPVESFADVDSHVHPVDLTGSQYSLIREDGSRVEHLRDVEHGGGHGAAPLDWAVYQGAAVPSVVGTE